MGTTLLAMVVLAFGIDGTEKAVQGAWIVTEAHREGKEAPDVVGRRLVIDGDTFEIREGEKSLFKGALEIDKSSGRLWRVDFKHEQGDAAGKTWLGVMRVRDDGVMDVCDNAVDPEEPRPETLESKPGSGTILLEFHRSPK